MDQRAASKLEPRTTPLLAWAPSGLDRALGGILVEGPQPVTLDRETWMTLLWIRVQTLINQDPNPLETIKAALETAEERDLLELREPKTSWAASLFQVVGGIKITLAETTQEWPAVVEADDPELWELLAETTLDEWLGCINY